MNDVRLYFLAIKWRIKIGIETLHWAELSTEQNISSGKEK